MPVKLNTRHLLLLSALVLGISSSGSAVQTPLQTRGVTIEYRLYTQTADGKIVERGTKTVYLSSNGDRSVRQIEEATTITPVEPDSAMTKLPTKVTNLDDASDVLERQVLRTRKPKEPNE